jgi:hypothetical protein
MTQIYQIQPPDKLLRWLHPGQFKWDEMRATSAAFQDPYMSIDVACLTTLQESYDRAQKIGKNAVVSILAKQAFEKNQKVHHCPTKICESSGSSVCLTDADCPAYQRDGSSKHLVCVNPAHGCVVGEKKKSVARSFARECEVEIYPAQADDSD